MELVVPLLHEPGVFRKRVTQISQARSHCSTNSPADTPVFTVAFLPIMERAYVDLLDDPSVQPLWRLTRGSGFHYSSPADWAAHDPTKIHKIGADFDIGLFIIGNKKGLEQRRESAQSARYSGDQAPSSATTRDHARHALRAIQCAI